MTSSEVEHARSIGDRIRALVPESQTCSVGVAGWDGIESGDELMARADGALYEAKRAGRNRTAVAGP